MNPIPIDIRWLVRADYPKVIAIEEECFGVHALTNKELTDGLHGLRNVGVSAWLDDDIAGFMLYELFKEIIHLTDLAVTDRCRHLGVGTVLMKTLIDKLGKHDRSKIILEVRETNLAGQLFFRQMGFRATEVLRNHFSDIGEDAYRMSYVMKGHSPVNRLFQIRKSSGSL